MSTFYVAPVDCLTSMIAPRQQKLLKGARAIKLFGTQVERAPFASASSQSLRSDFLCRPAGQKHFPVFLLRPMPEIWAPFGMFQPHFEAFRPERGFGQGLEGGGRAELARRLLSYRTQSRFVLPVKDYGLCSVQCATKGCWPVQGKDLYSNRQRKKKRKREHSLSYRTRFVFVVSVQLIIWCRKGFFCPILVKYLCLY